VQISIFFKPLDESTGAASITSSDKRSSLEDTLDIVKALHQRAAELQNELGKIQQAIRALSGAKIGVRNHGRKFRHTAATKRKLRLAQQRIWAAKRKK
jgi:hypothetical protein